MKEFIISEAQTEKAVLVGLVTPEQNEQKVKEYLDELAFLADTAGVDAVKPSLLSGPVNCRKLRSMW